MNTGGFEIFIRSSTGPTRPGDQPALGADVLGKAVVYVPDRPGVLAELASMFALHGVNITLFHYNRSEHANRVILEGRADSAARMESAFAELGSRGMHDPARLEDQSLELTLTDTAGILNIEVELEHRPGTLGRFAALIGRYHANVMHMQYNEDVSPTTARLAISAPGGAEVDALLKEMNTQGLKYSLLYKGAHSGGIDEAIGLNLVEKFFFKLKDTLGATDARRIEELVHSSQDIFEALKDFAREAGGNLEAGEVFSRVLAFATSAVLKRGGHFSYDALPVLTRGELMVHVFRLPAGGNITVLSDSCGLSMIDGSYGIYYEDVKGMLRANGLEPSEVHTIYLSHADSDHAGMSGIFEREFGTRVRLHRCARRVLSQRNRAEGSRTPYMELNRLYTIFVDTFTESAYPTRWEAYGTGEGLCCHGFPVIDSFEAGGMDFFILESLGGHVPGQVFFVSPEAGILFTSDYMLNTDSLGPQEREILGVARHMMVSTNVDSTVFRSEMQMLGTMVQCFKADAGTKGITVIPGHGSYYLA